MSLIGFDGFDEYDNGADAEIYGLWRWDSSFNITSSGRTGGKAFESASGLSYGVYPIPNQSGKTIVIGCAFLIELGHTRVGHILNLKNLMTIATGNIQCGVRVNSDDKLEIVRGLSTVLGTGTSQLAENTWYYLELKALVANAGGTMELKLNGLTEISTFTGDTQNEGNDDVVSIGLGAQSNGVECFIDDFYILNTDGTINNDYLGDVSIEFLTPNADGTVAWTKSGGASNYLLIDDPLGTPDDDTTYVSSSVSTTKDSYDMPNMTAADTVNGVKVYMRGEKDTENPQDITYGITNGANVQTVSASLGEGYGSYQQIFEDKDGASTAWTDTDVNGATLTIEVS